MIFNHSQQCIKERTVDYSICAACLSVITVFSYLSLVDPWLWYDEAVQFWVSKGLNHVSAPYAVSGNFSDVIESNRLFTFDPGGFSIITFFWLKLTSFNVVLIRLLPYLCFIGFATFAFLYIFRVRKNLVESAVITTLFFMWPITADTMTELRPYSMEMLGIASTLYFVDKFSDSRKPLRYLFLLSLWMSFFCTSRYDFIIFCVGISLYIIYELYRRNGLTQRFFFQCAIFGIPLAITVGMVWLSMMRYQIDLGAMELKYVNFGGKNPRFVLGSGMFVFSILNLAIIIRGLYKDKVTRATNIVFIIEFILYLVMTFSNKYPWDTKRTIAIIVTLTLTLIANILPLINTSTFVKMLIVLALFKTNCGVYEITHIRYGRFYHDIYSEYISTIDTLQYDNIYIDKWMEPSLRYLYEYGAMRGDTERDGYPQKFVFQYVAKDNQNVGTPILAKEADCDVYLLPDPRYPNEQRGFMLMEGKQFFYIKNQQ